LAIRAVFSADRRHHQSPPTFLGPVGLSDPASWLVIIHTVHPNGAAAMLAAPIQFLWGDPTGPSLFLVIDVFFSQTVRPPSGTPPPPQVYLSLSLNPNMDPLGAEILPQLSAVTGGPSFHPPFPPWESSSVPPPVHRHSFGCFFVPLFFSPSTDPVGRNLRVGFLVRLNQKRISRVRFCVVGDRPLPGLRVHPGRFSTPLLARARTPCRGCPAPLLLPFASRPFFFFFFFFFFFVTFAF